MKTIRIMLVDDHEIVRTGLRSYLEKQDGIQVVAEAGGGLEALDTIADARPDVVVMDITMPGIDGLEATRRLKEKFPEIQVLALTVHGDKQYLFEMMAAGATGYITKQSAADELVEAVRSVANGNLYLQPALARWLLEDYRRLSEQLSGHDGHRQSEPEGGHTRLDILSTREQQVLQHVAEGMSNPQIGQILGISHKTVARHRERIMHKLDMHSSTELVKFAIRTGLIDIG
jgi:DNA-binding NarL/FixJ family response regulator